MSEIHDYARKHGLSYNGAYKRLHPERAKEYARRSNAQANARERKNRSANRKADGSPRCACGAKKHKQAATCRACYDRNRPMSERSRVNRALPDLCCKECKAELLNPSESGLCGFCEVELVA